MWISHATSPSRLLWNRIARWQETARNNTSEEYSSSTDVFFTFTVERRFTNLWVAPYSQYQQFLYDTINDLREKRWNYRQIAEWMNQNEYKTPRGKMFHGSHVHSIVKKKKTREIRLNQIYPPKLSKFCSPVR